MVLISAKGEKPPQPEYPFEEAFAKGGNSDKVKLIPSLASNHIRTPPGRKSTSSLKLYDLHHIPICYTHNTDFYSEKVLKTQQKNLLSA